MTKSRNLKYCSELTPEGKCKEKTGNVYLPECENCEWLICCWACPSERYEYCSAIQKCEKVEEKYGI